MTNFYCPNCGEQLIDLADSVPGEFPPHDLQRCKAIEHAFAMEASGKGTKLSALIVDAVIWLAAHADPCTRRGIRIRADRRLFLDHYLELFRKRGG